MGLPGCLFVCHLILLLMCFLFNYKFILAFTYLVLNPAGTSAVLLMRGIKSYYHLPIAFKVWSNSIILMLCERDFCLRDGPFDIRGGCDFSSRPVFFLSFCTTSYFFQKLTATRFFFWKKH